MSGLHGIIYAYHSSPELGALVAKRTGASVPFCARYRLIDFSLSSMMNAGVRDVGVIMRKDYQSLLDHLSNGRDWDMSRHEGGLRLLPPFGLPGHINNYRGNLEALAAVGSYIGKIKAEDVVISRGDMAASIDLAAAYRRHSDAGAGITAVCSPETPAGIHHRYIPDEDGFARAIINATEGPGDGLASCEVYIIKKALLLDFIERRDKNQRLHLHAHAIPCFLADGGRLALYVHRGFARHITSLKEYYSASMELLNPGARAELFPVARPVRTRIRADVGTYFGEAARVGTSLSSDGCRIDGALYDSIAFQSVSVARGARVESSILLQGAAVGKNASLRCVIAAKRAVIPDNARYEGTPENPLVIG